TIPPQNRRTVDDCAMIASMCAIFIQADSLVSYCIIILLSFSCQEILTQFEMDEVKMDTKDETYYLYELINEKPVSPFGEALYKICRRFGITQPLLEKYAEAEYALMEAEGKIAVQSSMKQQVISRVVTGLQRTSYLQTFIWLK